MIQIKRTQFNLNLSMFFLLFSLFIGLTFVFVTPPLQAPDEQVHFFRAYHISEFNILEDRKGNIIGGYLPKSLIRFSDEVYSDNIAFHPENKQSLGRLRAYVSIPLNERDKIFYGFASAATYFPIVYLPQSTGILIGRILNLSPLYLMYSGRIFNLLCYAYISYLAVGLMPIGKRMLIVIALTPMAVFQAASLSADGVTNSLSFLLISLLLNYSFNKKEKLTKKDIIILFALSLAVSLSKQAYFLISLLYLLIPAKKFGSKINYFSLFILLIFSNILVILLWTWIVKYAIVPYQPGVSAQGQIRYILSNPVEYIKVLFTTAKTYWSTYLTGMIGRLGWLDTVLPPLLIKSYFIAIILTAALDNDTKIDITPFQRIILVISATSGIVITATLLYLSFTKVGNSIVVGIQGRYFIPLSPLLFLMFYNRIFKINKRYLSVLTGAFAILGQFITLVVMINRYYSV